MERESFELYVEETTDSSIVYIQGELDLAVAGQFRSAIEPLIPSDKSVVINLRNLTYIDSTGMGIIIFILKARKEEGKPFIIEDTPPKIKRLFDLTGISKFLPEQDKSNASKAEGI